MNRDHDIPVVHHTISIRSPRAVLLLNPTLPIVLSLLFVSVVFTIWPEALDHSPISFERRGIVHHVWHYSLLAGSLLALVGMFATFRRRLQLELAGTFLLVGSLTINLIAMVNELEPAETFLPVGAFTINLIAMVDESGHPVGDPPSGLGMAIRAGVILMLAIRTYILIAEPTIEISATEINEGR